MSLDTTIPARFLTSAYRDDDLIVIAYRCLRPRPDVQKSGVSTGLDDADVVAATVDNGDVSPKPQRPIWHHRFVTAATARSARYLAWLRHLNAAGNDIYVSMNTFASRDGRRTEANVAEVRHVYADFDSGGDAALRALGARSDLPPLSYVIHSSIGRFQAVWNVSDFDPPYAKRLLCHLAYTLGADLAVHDLNRVLRLPGFFNFKYSPPQFVRFDLGDELGPHGPSAFPVPPDDCHVIDQTSRERPKGLPGTTKAISRSERDWATVRSALSAGVPWADVWRDLVETRRDKANPDYYASLTVLKALTSLDRPHPPELVTALHASRTRRTR